jgi:hypothetical protein
LTLLLYILLLVLIGWFFKKSPFIQKSELGWPIIYALFGIRVLFGIGLHWISYTYYPNNDYIFLQEEALKEYEWLMQDPIAFTQDIIKTPYQHGYGNFFGAVGSFWKDLSNNLIIKFLAIINLFTQGNFYVNSLLLNIFPFLGSLAFYKTFKPHFSSQRILLIFGSFLIPSTLYFSSGIHKDMFVFTALCFLIYIIEKIHNEGFSIQRLLLLILISIGIGLFRNFILLALIPCLIGYWISLSFPKNTYHIQIFTALVIFLASLMLTMTAPKISPWQIVAARQHDFLQLKPAKSQLPVFTLENTPTSIVKQLPKAIDHGFFRPYIWSRAPFYSILLGAEILIYWIFISIVKIKKRKYLNSALSPMSGLCLFLSLNMLLIIGYVVPNALSIVRYRSIFLPFLLISFLLAYHNKESNT